MLPGISGMDLRSELRDRWPELAVILMSGYPQDEALRDQVHSGEVRFLQKPFGIAQLARELHAALAGRPSQPA
jgi:FixJ family two-component response regulator